MRKRVDKYTDAHTYIFVCETLTTKAATTIVHKSLFESEIVHSQTH